MGKASISIAISGSYNGSAVSKAEKSLERLAVRTAAAEGSISKSWAEAGAAAAVAGGQIYNTGQRMASAGDAMTAGITVPLAAAGVAAGKAAVDIDTALTGVRKTVDGTEEQYQQLKDAAIDFSQTNAVSADQMLDIEALGAQLGYTLDTMSNGKTEIQEFGEVVSGLDIATNMDAETAGTELAQFANITGMAKDQSENYASAIVNLGNNMATTESDISSMSMRVAAAGTQAGMSQSDILGFSAAMSSLGIEAEAGGTAFSQWVSTIDAAVATGGDQLETYASIAGMSADDFAASWQSSSTDTVQALLKGLAASDNMTVSLEEMGVTGVRQSDVLKRLAGNTDLVSQALQISNQGWTENTALQKEVENRNDSMAAKLEMLKNKVTAIAEDVGTPLMNALLGVVDASEPLVQGIGDAAQAFADMDEGGQRMVLGMAGVAAAAGPVLSITGRMTQGLGSVVTAFGRFEQGAAVYADAMTTTNAASLKAYSANEKLAGALARNPAAQAAGGVQSYIDVVRDASVKTSEYDRAVRDLAKEQSKGSKASQEVIDSLTAEVSSRKEAADAAKGTVQGYQESAAAAKASATSIKAQSVAMKAASVAATGLKMAMGVIVPMAAIAGITAIVSTVKEAKEHEDNLRAATEGLTRATSENVSAASADASALDIFGGAAKDAKPDIDGLLESQARLAQTITDTNTTASGQMAQLQTAYGYIQEYANQSDLSAEAQGRLQTAVSTVNSLCGTQIQVTDGANGKLSDENGAIDDVTESLGGYIDAKMKQIQIDAQQQNLSALYQQQASDIQAVAQAQQAYSDTWGDLDKRAQDYYDTMQRTGNPITYDQAKAQVEAQAATSDEAKALSDAKSALDSTDDAIDNLTSSLYSQAGAADGSASSLRDVALASPVLTNAMTGMGKDINDFATDLANSGVSVEQYRSLSSEQLIQLADDWDGTTESIVTSMAGMGYGMSDAGLSAANALANGLASGQVSVETATGILQSAASGDWTGVESAMESAGISLPDSVARGISDGTYSATEATNEMLLLLAMQMSDGDTAAAAEMLGHDISQGLGDGITENSFASDEATSQTLSMIALKLSGGDVPAAAQLLGHDIDQGLADGIANGTLSEEQANYLGQDVINSAKDSLQSHSPSQAFFAIGQDVDAGLSNGIAGGAALPIASIFSVGQSLVSRISGVPGQARGIGGSTSISFAGGISSGQGATSSAARGLAGAASAMGNGDAYTWGSHLTSNFASGISAGVTWVTSAATSIAQAAKNAIGFSVPKEGPWSGSEKGGETSGLHLAQNFAAGMMSGRTDVSNAARSLASASYFTGGWSAAGTVPMQAGGGQRVQVVNQGDTINIHFNGAVLNDLPAVRQDVFALLDDLSRLSTQGA